MGFKMTPLFVKRTNLRLRRQTDLRQQLNAEDKWTENGDNTLIDTFGNTQGQ